MALTSAEIAALAALSDDELLASLAEDEKEIDAILSKAMETKPDPFASPNAIVVRPQPFRISVEEGLSG